MTFVPFRCTQQNRQRNFLTGDLNQKKFRRILRMLISYPVLGGRGGMDVIDSFVEYLIYFEHVVIYENV